MPEKKEAPKKPVTTVKKTPVTKTSVKTKKQTKVPPASSEKAVEKKKVQSETVKPSPTVEEDKGFLVDAAENIEEGVRIVSDRAADLANEIAGKTSEIAGEVFTKLHSGISQIYTKGSKVVSDATDLAQDYIKKYNDRKELKELSVSQDKLYSDLGAIVSAKYKEIKSDPNVLAKDAEVSTLINEIRALQKEIVSLGKKLDVTKK
jgi:cell fate (sporulation/competence/biofilm development) regulator YlbF (YheA/YmcA/DUF963 family)